MIRPISANDIPQIIAILRDIQEAGDSYYFLDMNDDELQNYWIKQDFAAFVFEQNGEVAGSYILGKVADGRFSHIANASYIVSQKHRGLGIAKKLGLHSIEFAKEQGYHAIQFMRVVSTNENAVNAWKNLGFSIIGTVPKAFNHKHLGFVDAHIMHREA